MRRCLVPNIMIRKMEIVFFNLKKKDQKQCKVVVAFDHTPRISGYIPEPFVEHLLFNFSTKY